MTIENALRFIAGSLALLSVALFHYVRPWRLLLTPFVGLNPQQSGFTGWFPMMWFLGKAGLRHQGAPP